MIGDPDPSFWKDRTVLVTGSGGFAGGHLVESLDKLGARVSCFLRQGERAPIHGANVTSLIGDVEDYGSLVRAFDNVDIGFHLAAITAIPEARANTFKTFATNALGTLNFLMAATERRARKLVYVSTCQVYGKPEHFPTREDELPHPIDIYSASKLAGENLAVSFAEASHLDTSISRAFNHYGPRQRSEFLIPQIMIRLLRRKPLELRNPRSTRDFSYVDDIVRGYILLAEKGRPSHIYHFCSGVERAVEEVVETIARLSEITPEIHQTQDASAVDVTRSVGDYSKARRELGWEPRVSFEEGLVRTLAWYKAHPEIEVPEVPGTTGKMRGHY